jgi:hypothetical protein
MQGPFKVQGFKSSRLKTIEQNPTDVRKLVPPEKLWPGSAATTYVFQGLVFKPTSERSRAGCMIKDTVVMHAVGAVPLCLPGVGAKNFSPVQPTPLSCARRGNPDFSRDTKRRGALFWGYPFFGHAKKGYKNKISQSLCFFEMTIMLDAASRAAWQDMRPRQSAALQ